MNGAFYQFSTEKYWILSNIIKSLCYFAVPVFFMIRGANLIDYDKKYTTKEYFIKRIKKTFIPFISFSLIGLIFSIIIFKNISIGDLSIKYIYNGIFNTSFINVY